MGGQARPLLSQIDPRRVLIIATDPFEADHLVSAFLSARSRPSEIDDDDIDVRRHPWLPGWKGDDGGSPQALPRITISLLRRDRSVRRLWVRARLELWCLQDLTESDPGGEAGLARALERAFLCGPAPDLVLFFGTTVEHRAGRASVVASLLEGAGEADHDQLGPVISGLRDEVEARFLWPAGPTISPPRLVVDEESPLWGRPGLTDHGRGLHKARVVSISGVVGVPGGYGRDLVAAHNAAVASAWLAPALIDLLFLSRPLRWGSAPYPAALGSP